MMITTRLFFAVALMLFAGLTVIAQTDRPSDPPAQNDFVANEARKDRPDRGNMIRRALNLSDEQMLRIREINRSTRPKMAEAEKRLRFARRELDQAIYADELEEPQLHDKVRAVVEAQAEITKIRASSEVAVRSVLTPEQLVRFRELRKRFAHQRKLRQLNQMRKRRMRQRMREQNQRRRRRQNPF